jgi:hypothetical protein
MRQLVCGIALAILGGCSSSETTPSSQVDAGGIAPDGSGTSGDAAPGGVDAGGGGDGGATVDGGGDSGSGVFTLTSSTWTEGGMIPVASTCNGANTSPPLAWTNAPPGTQSYALVLTDLSNNLVHSVMYDVPSSLSSLPAGVEKAYQPSNVTGAKQTLAYDNSTRGYMGPCPPSEHTYELALHALDVATLPGATMSTTRAQAVTIIQAHDLGVAKLTAKYKP